MSLFPAYNEANKVTVQNDAEKGAPNDSRSEWLENDSFVVDVTSLQNVQAAHKKNNPTSSSDSDSDEDAAATEAAVLKVHNQIVKPLEFEGTEEFYVDKQAEHGYRSIKRLHKPISPRYSIQLRNLSTTPYNKYIKTNGMEQPERYFKYRLPSSNVVVANMSELERRKIFERIAELNSKKSIAPEDLSTWLELYALNKKNIDKSNRLLLADKQLQLLSTGLKHHRGSEQLLRLFIEVANAHFPSNEVSTMLQQLLADDPYSYTLWTAQIMATQGTMARCNLPDVLKIYERCMRRMHRVHSQPHANSADLSEIDTDPIMLKLFHNCALFLRQAGCYDMFFALLKLALELNVVGNAFDNFNAKPADELSLIDYEELVLQSGLPMNEIWLRIEKLRQAFSFLPYPITQTHQDGNRDPQRCVFNEDICHYIYPFRARSNTFQLMLSIVQLTKLPFVRTHCLAQRLCARIEQIGDSDAIEMVLALAGQRVTYALPLQRDNEYLHTLYELAKEMSVNPTFLSHSIGHELYVNCIRDLLLNCATIPCSDVQKPHRIFILLWLRFERMQLVLEKLSGKLKPETARAGRARIKAQLKKSSNRREVAYYIELGLYEYELVNAVDDDARANILAKSVYKIFENIIISQQVEDENFENVNTWLAYVTFAELLMARKCRERALRVLTSLALYNHLTKHSQHGHASALIGINRLQQRLHEAVDESLAATDTAFPLVDYFLPNKMLTLLKACALLQCLVGQHEQALAQLDLLLHTKFVRHGDDRPANERISFLREQILELYMLVLQLPKTSRTANACSAKKCIEQLSDALEEFPRNLYFLQCWSMLPMLPWYKLRSRLLAIDANILSIIYLLAAIRYRFQKLSKEEQAQSTSREPFTPRSHLAVMVRNRSLNVFELLTPSNRNRSQSEEAKYEYLKRNALFWRFYLRCLSDERTSFERTKQCLLMALDECPWNKAIYIDGATSVPQEIGHMQDLLIEKRLRVYALPEELAILREH